jgi:hypothetical protein
VESILQTNLQADSVQVVDSDKDQIHFANGIQQEPSIINTIGFADKTGNQCA